MCPTPFDRNNGGSSDHDAQNSLLIRRQGPRGGCPMSIGLLTNNSGVMDRDAPKQRPIVLAMMTLRSNTQGTKEAAALSECRLRLTTRKEKTPRTQGGEVQVRTAQHACSARWVARWPTAAHTSPDHDADNEELTEQAECDEEDARTAWGGAYCRRIAHATTCRFDGWRPVQSSPCKATPIRKRQLLVQPHMGWRRQHCVCV